MKKADWARYRGTDHASAHPLSQMPLPALVAGQLSGEMWEVLARVVRFEDGPDTLGVDGDRLSGFNTKPKTVEALWYRGLIRVFWRSVRIDAPLPVRVGRVSVTDRGRAALATKALLQPPTASPDATWAGVPSVQVFG